MSLNKKSIGPSPSLAIAIDPFSCAIAMDVEEVIRGSFVNTPLLQKFLYLTSLGDKPSFLSLQEMVEARQDSNSTLCTPKEIPVDLSKLKG